LLGKHRPDRVCGDGHAAVLPLCPHRPQSAPRHFDLPTEIALESPATPCTTAMSAESVPLVALPGGLLPGNAARRHEIFARSPDLGTVAIASCCRYPACHLSSLKSAPVSCRGALSNVFLPRYCQPILPRAWMSGSLSLLRRPSTVCLNPETS